MLFDVNDRQTPEGPNLLLRCCHRGRGSGNRSAAGHEAGGDKKDQASTGTSIVEHGDVRLGLAPNYPLNGAWLKSRYWVILCQYGGYGRWQHLSLAGLQHDPGLINKLIQCVAFSGLDPFSKVCAIRQQKGTEVVK
jgi:hypothetical protein